MIHLRALRRAVLCLSSLLPQAGTALAAPCEFTPGDPNLEARDGFAEFIAADKLQPFKNALPHVENAALEAVIRSPDTMWYDEESMVFLYQDSVEVVVGGRANCVGRKVGEANRNNPPIAKLMNYFGTDYRFKFPFRKAAGTDNVTNVKVFNFWAPPRQGGSTLPVRWWKASARGRWHWVFPVGTMFGEVLYQKGPDDRWHVFEIRTRKRYRDGWEVDLFRPFATASSLADAVVAKRPNWRNQADLNRLVTHLRNPATLVPHRMVSEAYGAVFPAINGALDKLPAVDDSALIAELLDTTTFKSTEGAIWKENGGLETYAPSSEGDFQIVPRGYEMGMIPVNEVSCNRCHEQTARPLGTIEGDIVLYGEVWGEDRAFTWHLFQPNQFIYNTFDDSDSNTRRLNPRLVTAGLLKNERPAANDPNYKQLPTPF